MSAPSVRLSIPPKENTEDFLTADGNIKFTNESYEEFKRQQRFVETVRRIKDHSCALVTTPDFATTFISEGLCVKLRRRVRQYLTISNWHPKSFKLLHSTCQIEEERKCHLLFFNTVIHPFSLFRLHWSFFMMWVYLATFITIPLEVILHEKDVLLENAIYWRVVLDVFNWMDIFLHFICGIYVQKYQRVCLYPKYVVKHYLTGYFIIDVLSAFPYTVFMWLGIIPEHVYEAVSVLCFLRVLRLKTLDTYVEDFCEFFKYKYLVRTTIQIVLYCVFLFVYVTAIIYYSLIMDSQYNGVPYLNIIRPISAFIFGLMHFSAGLMFHVGLDLVPNRFNGLMIAIILTIFVGFFFNIILLSKCVLIYKRLMSTKNKYKRLNNEINEFIQYKCLSQELRSKIQRYLHFKFQKNIFKEESIYEDLSTTLQEEIRHHMCCSFVERVEFFRDFPLGAMMRIVNMLKMEIFLPNDLIFQAGVTGHTMYFIYAGKVAVYTRTNREICHLYEGDHFGEIALLINMPRTATVVAITECELYRLTRKDFMDAIAPYPDINKKVWKLAEERLFNTQEMSKTDLHESEIVSNLSTATAGTE